MTGGSDIPGKILQCDGAQTVELVSWWNWLMLYVCHCSRG